MEKLINDFSVGLFFWQTLLFLVLLFVLRKVAWKPILKAVNDREQSISDSLAAAEQARQEMDNLKAENEKIMQEARIERDAMIKEAREIREKMIEEAKGKASTEADKMIESAREQINNEKLAAITELKNQVATLSIEIAEKVLGEELKSNEKQDALVGSMLEDVKLN